MLGGLEQLIGVVHKETLLPKTAHILKVCYDLDILEEETILEWGQKVSNGGTVLEWGQKVSNEGQYWAHFLYPCSGWARSVFAHSLLALSKLAHCSAWNGRPWPGRSQNWMLMYFIINLSGSQQFSGSSIQNQVELSEWATGRFMHCHCLCCKACRRRELGVSKSRASSKATKSCLHACSAVICNISTTIRNEMREWISPQNYS